MLFQNALGFLLQVALAIGAVELIAPVLLGVTPVLLLLVRLRLDYRLVHVELGQLFVDLVLLLKLIHLGLGLS